MFNAVEGVINHHILSLHHVNETVPRESWIYWDIAFTRIMLAAGWLLLRQGERETPAAVEVKGVPR
jgi:uncharacterized membrane protein